MNSLEGQLLIAMPTLGDPNFHRTVTLVCEHNKDGALGIVINRPMRLQMREIFEQMGFQYIGPVDGHDIDHLVELLELLMRH